MTMMRQYLSIMGPSLENSEKESVYSALGVNARDVKAVTVARLYQASPGARAWTYQNVMGAVCLVSANGGMFIKIVDLSSEQVKFEMELYENMPYEAPKDFFHTFEIESCVAGLSFAEADEAKTFLHSVQGSVPRKVGVSTSPASSGRSSSPSTPGKKEKKQKGKKGKKGKDAVAEMVISGPTDFKHVSHIGWDPDRGFELRNIPPEWKKLFHAAGIKKSELRDKETAKFIMDFVAESVSGGGDGGSGPAPPPPPMGGGGPAPPPPPPPTGGGGSGGDLLSQIRGGTSLRSADAAAPSATGMPELPPEQTEDLAAKLSSAITGRRAQLMEDDEQYSDDDEDEWDY